ncbi:hypothetical protein KIN20_007062 [Parelaphostrongylus tenuis]|uniref:Uncharacterized protein n=1 Tax=Parelaphostrongylus tenuis TaxID=148309 RepID=A0AAD5ML02_PARTN|nr:hypothetical protein KIN20_007062 [Parelaphostrongylus tenuis]
MKEILIVMSIAVIVWLIVYCLIVAQRCVVDSKYAEDMKTISNTTDKERDLQPSLWLFDLNSSKHVISLSKYSFQQPQARLLVSAVLGEYIT